MDLTEPFQLITFIITVVTLCLQAYVIFLIVYVSPKSMAVYRRYLVITTVFEMLYTFDFGIVIMNEPPEFFPGAGTFVRGIAGEYGESAIRISASASYFLAGCMLGSQDVALIYRYLAVHPNRELCQKFTSLSVTLFAYGIVFVMSFGAGIGAYFVIAPQSEHQTIIESWTMRSTGQHATNIDLATPRLLLYNNKPFIGYFFNIIGLCLAISEIGYFIVVFKILRILHVNSRSFSRKSINLHRQLTLLLAAQVLVPLLMLIGPYSLLFYRMKTETVNGKFETQLGLIFFICHFTVIALITIFFIKPYRNFLVEKLGYLIYRNKPPAVFTRTAVVSSFNSYNT